MNTIWVMQSSLASDTCFKTTTVWAAEIMHHSVMCFTEKSLLITQVFCSISPVAIVSNDESRWVTDCASSWTDVPPRLSMFHLLLTFECNSPSVEPEWRRCSDSRVVLLWQLFFIYWKQLSSSGWCTVTRWNLSGCQMCKNVVRSHWICARLIFSHIPQGRPTRRSELWLIGSQRFATRTV